jgi:hypothetical protein
MLVVMLSGPFAQAYRNNSVSLGVGYYSQNALGKTTTTPDSKASFLGAPSYPLNFKYDWSFVSDWYLSPQLSYAFMARNSGGSSAKVTMMHFVLPVGQNIGYSMSALSWDWFVGPGFMQYTIKGAGGTEVMSNGTSTATFALPGDAVTVKTVTMNAGGSLNYDNSRFGLDLVFEGFGSSGKRTESFMLSYAYRFGGSYR